MINIFIIGSRGLPANYGGYETFVRELTGNNKNKEEIRYHIACKSRFQEVDYADYEYNNARCFCVKVPRLGSAEAIYYDVAAIMISLRYIEQHKIDNAVIYVLACRIGPLAASLVRRARKKNIRMIVNPDGHEWMRKKWSYPVRQYWKISERLMVKHFDYIICDSKAIEDYIKERYKRYLPSTTFIAYGADIDPPMCEDSEIREWYQKWGLSENSYYLIVGRFVPENNYEIMIKGFMASDSKKDLVIITDWKNNTPFYTALKKRTSVQKDKRIKFVGTVYDKPLINRIRKQAFGYFHGHEVGGTNPSLLEAMACGSAILAINVSFSKEVLGEGGIFWEKDIIDLKNLIHRLEKRPDEILHAKEFNKKRVSNVYTWDKIESQYNNVWTQLEENTIACKILGTDIAVTDIEKTIQFLKDNLERLKGRYICVSNVHTTVMAYEDEKYREIQNKAVLALPDGKPLSLVSRMRGFKQAKRVAGPDLMPRVLALSEEYGFTHFFYGTTNETLELFRQRLNEDYPKLEIAGMYSPPFRELNDAEEKEVVSIIQEANPDFIWVGLGAPKQEIWMSQHQNKVPGVMLGVGAAFDFYAGTSKRAPRWMQECYLEWLWRLARNPKRLFKRYFISNIKFIYLVLTRK